MRTSDDQSPRILNEDEANRVVRDVQRFSGLTGAVSVSVSSWWAGSQRWARSKANLTSDQRDVNVVISRQLQGGLATVMTNQLDEESLKGACEYVEYYASVWAQKSPVDMELQLKEWDSQGKNVWSDETFNRKAEENGTVLQSLLSRSRENNMLSAGYIEMFGSNVIKFNRDRWGRESHSKGRATQAQCSITVRHPGGTASGWAGASAFDLQSVNISAIADLALEKSLKSADPVRIEPGRYVSILEPQATATFATLLVGSLFRRIPEQGSPSPWVLGVDETLKRFRSKLGLNVVDPRVTIEHNPVDAVVGTHIAPGIRPVSLIKNGVLNALYNDYEHGLSELVDPNPDLSRLAFRFKGTNTTIESMIESTQRGLLVSRFAQPEYLDVSSLLFTGVTRDGLWLIENGKVTKAVRNFRWTESPVFVFNNIDSIGIESPVFYPVTNRNALDGGLQNATSPLVVPSLKVNDFSFTATIDAI